jgi:hypothetical protein
MMSELANTRAEELSAEPQRGRILRPTGELPRLPEIGRLRSGGQKVDERRPGPALKTWRITSVHRDVVETMAEAYGGKVETFTQGGREEWQVVTEASSLPVVLIKPEFESTSQNYEQWSGSGCRVRCDGQRANVRITYKQKVKGKQVDLDRWELRSCHGEGTGCPIDQPICKLTSRLLFTLPICNRIGAFRFQTGGSSGDDMYGIYWMGLQALAQGQMIKAAIRLQPTRTKGLRTADNPTGTRQYVAPILDILAVMPDVTEIAAPRDREQIPPGTRTGAGPLIPPSVAQADGPTDADKAFGALSDPPAQQPEIPDTSKGEGFEAQLESAGSVENFTECLRIAADAHQVNRAIATAKPHYPPDTAEWKSLFARYEERLAEFKR